MEDHNTTLPLPQLPRRPRGFAAYAGKRSPGSGAKGGKKEREKERTKLRERHRRAITSRMLSGLRQHGNFPLPARADMNDVLAALAREAGWIVDADGTTYRKITTSVEAVEAGSINPPDATAAIQHLVDSFPGESSLSLTSFINNSSETSLSCHHHSVLSVNEEVLSPSLLESVVAMNGVVKDDKHVNTTRHINSTDCFETDEMLQEVLTSEKGNDYSGSPYIPVYVTLPTGVINNFCQLVEPESLRQELWCLKSMHVDGVIVNCWWGIVEGWSPQKYLWSGYRDLFNIIQEFKLKLQVVLAFNDYLPVGSGDFAVTLPKWVLDIGKDNQDIFFTDSEGRRNTECLSWGIDKERVLQGRTGIEVYFDFMKSFRMEFDDLFAEGLILGLEIGLGASGELKYPSFSERMGWSYPGIGEFQCYDKYLQQSLHKAAKLRGHTSWGKAPDNAGCYKSHPNETEFFSNCGVYDSYYGRFFLHWYSQTLIDHADRVLTLTRLAFEDTNIIIKIPVVYWWYKTTSHAAELTAGFYNPQNHDGYCAIWKMLKKHSVTMKFVCPDPQIIENNEALADSKGLCLQILNSAWDQGLTIAAQNGCRMLDLKRTLEIAKPMDDPDHRHLSFFAYQRPLNAMSQTTDMGLSTLDYFVKLMHGEVIMNHHHQV